MDILWLEAVVRELEGMVADTRINKIHQPTADTLIFKLWTGRETLRLLVSLDGRFSRLHLTERDYPNPFTPMRFCQLLRSRLSVLTSIRQKAGERIVEIAFRGKEQDYLLIAELTGRHSNLILIDDKGQIVDALKRVDAGTEGRSIKPGIDYCYPQQQSRFDLRRELPNIPETVHSAEDFRRWLMDEMTPMTRSQAVRLVSSVESGETPSTALKRFRKYLTDDLYQPRIVGINEQESLLLFPDAQDLESQVQTFTTISAALDTYYYPLQFQSGQIGDGRELAVLIKKEIKKLKKRRDNIAGEEEKKSDFDERRQWGDLLLANLYLVQRGMEEVEVTDYSQDPPAQVKLKLDPRLSPQENAESFFKRYKKEKRGMGHVSRRLQETDDELSWFEGLSLALEDAESPEELQEIRQELLDAGVLKQQRIDPVRRKKEVSLPKLNSTVSPSGLDILWGKNNRSNDEISTRQTEKDDLWFHAHNQPGCHLVLKRGERKGELPDEDVMFAASIAAGYSRGRHDHKVEVMVTEGKNVRKPKGARPGLVTVNSYRAVIVPPMRMEENAD